MKFVFMVYFFGLIRFFVFMDYIVWYNCRGEKDLLLDFLFEIKIKLSVNWKFFN